MGITAYDGVTRKSGARYVWTGDVHYNRNVLKIPLRWKRPKRIFVNSMSDLFQRSVEPGFVREIWEIMEAAHWHTFQILTKRPESMWKIISDPGFPVLRNVWLGTSVESMAYKHRIRFLQETPAALRFISFEPLIGRIGPIDLTNVHWAIVGGESGPKARPMDPLWVEEIRKSCMEQDVPFFFKQWGGVNKKAAGRKYAGRTWDEFPATSPV